MIAAYTVPARGYMSLEPVGDLGNDPVVALWRAGVRSSEGGIPIARGRAMLILDGGSPRVVRIKATTAEGARRTALRELGAAEVVLLEAAYRGRFTVFRRTEILRAMSSSQASKDDSAQLVSAMGVIVQKALSPADPVDNKIISDRLAGQLRHTEVKLLGSNLERYIRRLKIDWPNLTPQQLSEELSQIRTGIRGMLGTSAAKMLPTWKIQTESTITGVVRGTKKAIKTNFLPQIGVSLSLPNQQAIDTIATQQGFFMRDAMGYRSDQITAAGRNIIQDGLKQGLGRNEIGKRLSEQLPLAWQKYGKNYFRTVAAVAVNRARSYAEIDGYVEAGIESLEVQAVLDERTTDICFSKGTMIATPEGEMPIEQIIKGQFVSAGMGKSCRVKSTMRRETDKVMCLLLSSGRHMLVTGNHPILTPRGWIPAVELKEGDSVASQRTNNSGRDCNELSQLREGFRDQANLLRSRRRQVLFPTMLARAPEKREKCFPLRKSLQEVQKNLQSETFVSTKETRVLLDGLSKKQGGNRLSILRGAVRGRGIKRRNFKVLFCGVQGAFKRYDQYRKVDCRCSDRGRLGMGERERSGEVFCGLRGSRTKISHRGGRRILARCGYGERPTEIQISEQKRGSHQRCGTDVDTDRRRCPNESYRQIKADSICVGCYIESVDDWITIEDTREIPGKRTVYNLSVENDPTYIAEGVIVHNCRCLDGQIIETHLASQQVLNAASVTTPEGILDASPFLKETVDRDTGVKSIVTTNNGTNIADVTRSGIGRVDDRGQFNRYIANNTLTDHNIGPPPYHHLCRSWTVPITTTTQVPRGEIPRAGGTTPPVPPKIIPQGSRIPPGVGPRPQTGGKTPTPTSPKPIGAPDYVERYPFTQDFIDPPGLSGANLIGRGKKMKDAAVYSSYRFDPLTRAIRGSGGPRVISRPAKDLLAQGKTPLSNTVTELKLKPDVSGVVMHLQKLDSFALKDIILGESRQLAARRVYSLRSADTGANFYLKFNGDKKRASYNHIRQLRAAKTSKQIKTAVQGLEQKGFVVPAHNYKEVVFGEPARAMKPLPLPNGAPRKPPPKKPKSPLKPLVRPKPKPTSTRATPTGQLEPKPKPKPKRGFTSETPDATATPGDPYSQYRLLDTSKESLHQQVLKRSKIEAARISDALTAAESKFPSRLTPLKRERLRAKTINNFIQADTGKVEKFTSKTVRQYQTQLPKLAEKTLQKVTRGHIDSGSLTKFGRAKLEDVKLRKLPDSEVAKLMNGANESLSQRVINEAKRKGLPIVYEATNTVGGAFYSSAFNTIIIPQESFKGLGSVFRHEYSHYIDVLGKNDPAATQWRKLNAIGKEKKSPRGWKYLRGKWGERYTGRVYESGGTEVTSTFAETLGTNRAIDLNRMYDANPEHAGYYLAQAKGSFLP